jgi:hypothetical protein
VANELDLQRIPLGLRNLLGIVGGGQNPRSLVDAVNPVLDTLQFYGQTQERVQNSAVIAEGATVAIGPSPEWWLVYSIQLTIVKTGTMTALHASISAGQLAAVGTLYGRDYGPFGATETGTIADGITLPYPRLLPPGSFLQASLNILGTDANANVGVAAIIARLGA